MRSEMRRIRPAYARCSSDVDGDDVGALLGQPDRVAAVLAPRGASDEGDFPVYTGHAVLVLSGSRRMCFDNLTAADHALV